MRNWKLMRSRLEIRNRGATLALVFKGDETRVRASHICAGTARDVELDAGLVRRGARPPARADRAARASAARRARGRLQRCPRERQEGFENQGRQEQGWRRRGDLLRVRARARGGGRRAGARARYFARCAPVAEPGFARGAGGARRAGREPRRG